MVSWKLLVYCVLAGGVWLLALSLLFDYLGRRLRVTESIPPELVEAGGIGLTLANFITEFIFFVAIPTLAYGFFSYLIPLAGIRAGMAAALLAFGLGAVPAVLTISLRLKLPAPYLLFLLLMVLIKLAGTLAIIAYLYNL